MIFSLTPGIPRAQAADPPDLEIDFYPGHGGPVECGNAFLVDKCVHLEDEVATALFFMECNLPVDPGDHPAAQGHGSNNEFPVLVEPGIAGAGS